MYTWNNVHALLSNGGTLTSIHMCYIIQNRPPCFNIKSQKSQQKSERKQKKYRFSDLGQQQLQTSYLFW